MAEPSEVPERTNGSQILGSFAHPLALLCLGGWVLNDHVLKASFGNPITGKLSDVFGLAVFPLLVAALLPNSVSRRIGWASATTAIFFVAINVSSQASDATVALLDVFLPNPRLTPDQTDLVALPALAIARWIWARPIPLTSPMVRRIGITAFSASLVATLATSANDTVQSDRLITRVERLPDGDFAALHHSSIALGPSRYGDPEEVFDPVGDLRLGGPTVVYTSTDGADWLLDSTIDPSTIEWSVDEFGCVQETCVEFEARLLGDGSVSDVEGRTVFTLIEPAPACHDGLGSRLSPFRGSDCASNSAPGPVDIAVNSDSGIAVVALGTQGVAVFDGADWQQVAIDTPGPRSWFSRNLATLVWIGLTAVLWLFALLGLVAYLRRYREPVIVEANPSEDLTDHGAKSEETPD